ncbi:MAG: hypothetical protein J6S79_05045 [Lachnospiraceae bacterium]|nr:hypothetical protein [Lachnospiraceae bacterium]
MKRILLIVVLLVSLLTVPALADGGTAPKEIYTVDDLLAVASDPSGSYILMADIDMNGVAWPAITFTGTFNGNHHMILNLNNAQVSTETRVTYDGNRKTYDTHFAALFAVLEHATVRDLRLINMDNTHTFEGDCFLGTIAGFASESTIENCEISGTVRLDVTGKMFGVGGVIGFGNCVVKDCTADVTLINIDLDKDHRDEQFLGGVCGAGYPDIDGCTVNLAGYISDHGYVHSGGLVGMYIVYPQRFSRNGYIKNNKLDGFITFFEDNSDRRAYCEARCGEIMDWQFSDSGNVYHFTRDERRTYTVNLLPHECETPDYNDVTVDPSCDNPGYTAHICKTCGYTYRDSYVLPKHTLSETYDVIKEATLTETGIGEFTCTACGAKIRQELPMLSPTPTPTPEPTIAPTATPVAAESVAAAPSDTTAAKDQAKDNSKVIPIICGILILASAVLLVRIIIHARRMKKR